MGVVKRVQTTYTFTCGCKHEFDVEKLEDAEKLGWSFSSLRYPATEESIKDVRCPACSEKERARKFSSDDIKERISVGYYSENPLKWEEDLLEYLGISKDHPKAKKILSMAWERGHSSGYREVLSNAEELEELIE